MQALYIKEVTKDIENKAIIDFYRKVVDDAYDILKLQLFLLAKIAESSKEDEERRKTKLLPSDFDRLFTAKLFNNPVTQSLYNKAELKSFWKKHEIDNKLPEDFAKKLYRTFSPTDSYNEYISSESQIEQHRTVLLEIYKSLVKNELFYDTMEDLYFNWLDDESIIIGTIKKILKSLPEDFDFQGEYGINTEAVDDFGEKLLAYILSNDKMLDDKISPLLVNWDMERIADIDKIFIKMSMSEMIIFPTIPTKVSINEYLELAKSYSADKSKEFVNGILDRLLHQMESDGTIVKKGRGLVD